MLAFGDVLNLLFFEHVEYASLGVMNSLLSRGLCRFWWGCLVEPTRPEVPRYAPRPEATHYSTNFTIALIDTTIDVVTCDGRR